MHAPCNPHCMVWEKMIQTHILPENIFIAETVYIL